MNSSDPLPLFNTKSFTVMKGGKPINQVMSFKAVNMQRMIQVVQRVAQKSCRRACQLLCCPLDSLLWEKTTYCPAQNHQLTEDELSQVALRSPPSTILIVNISNSTLIDCVIGNDTYPSVVAERQPLIQESASHMHDKLKCSYSHGQQGAAQASSPPSPPQEETPSINILSSHLNCVIIGDNNYMLAEQIYPTETVEPRV